VRERFATLSRAWLSGNKTFEVVKDFVCLRSLVTPNNDMSRDIQMRFQTANRCQMWPETRKCRRKYNFELEREFDSPCVINVVRTNRLSYAGLKDLRNPQKPIFIAGSLGTQIERTELSIESYGKKLFDNY
jgi:hypothetical protein